MEISNHPEVVDAVVEIRRGRLQLLPDPMELAKLATSLNPDLAAGNAEEQRSAIHLARSLFDLAVASAETPTAAEIARTANPTVVVEKSQTIAEQTTSGPNSFVLTEDGYEKNCVRISERSVSLRPSCSMGGTGANFWMNTAIGNNGHKSLRSPGKTLTLR